MAARPAQPEHAEDFARLDGVPVVPTSRPFLAQAVILLFNHLHPDDRRYLNNLTSLASRVARLYPRLQPGLTLQFERSPIHPVATILLRWLHSERCSAPLDLLTAILANAALGDEAVAERKRILSLCRLIGGALTNSPSSPLEVVLVGASNLCQLHSCVEQALQTKSSLAPRFQSLWKSWLRDRVAYWMLAFVVDTELEFTTPNLVASLDSGQLTIRTDPQADADDTADVPSNYTPPNAPGDASDSVATERKMSQSVALTRASHSDVLFPADHFVPSEIIQQLAQLSITSAQEAMAAHDFDGAESVLSLAIGIAAGLRSWDLVRLRWGLESDSSDRLPEHLRLSVSLHESVLIRPLMRPPNSVMPNAEVTAMCLSGIQAFRWPLPPSLHGLLLSLSKGKPAPGSPVLARYTTPTRRRFHDTIAQLMPGLPVGLGAIRRAMAAHLAAVFGPEIVQMTMGDSFSTSVAPTHYAAADPKALRECLAVLLAEWFGEKCLPDPRTPAGHLGSRLILTDDVARQWPGQLRAHARSVAHRKSRSWTEEWIAQRNLLAGALCAATGHRPVDAIGDIGIDDVIPEHGLIVIRDKQVDPLRKVRIAVVGKRWIRMLHDYVDRLVEVGRADEGEVSALAMSVLVGDAPLFAVPGPGGVETLNAAGLRSTMPESLRQYGNHYRHRLNHLLQRHGIDPELRHAQLGWIVSPAHALAELSHFTPIDFSDRVGPVIDKILVGDGWTTGGRRLSPWRWEPLPERMMNDWRAAVDEHEGDHRRALATLRRELRQRGRKVAECVLPRLGEAIHLAFPLLRLDLKTRSLQRADGKKSPDPVEVSTTRCNQLLDWMRHGDARPEEALEAYTARVMLHGLLRSSHRREITQGTLPRRPYASLTADPSPFLPRMGLALRQVRLMRDVLGEHINQDRAHERGILAVLSVILQTPYRDLQIALAVVGAATRAMRGKDPGDELRLTVSVGNRKTQLVISGQPALLIARRAQEAPKAVAPKTDRIAAWLHEHMPAPLSLPEGEQALEALVHAARVAGRVELSGQERLLMLGAASLATVSVERCLAASDAWPLRTAPEDETAQREQEAPAAVEELEVEKRPATRRETITQYRTLTSLLNPDLYLRNFHKESDSRYGWRSALKADLDDLAGQVTPGSVLELVIRFAKHVHVYGGPHKKKLKHRSLETVVTRFARSLLDIAGDRVLPELGGQELQDIYLAVLLGKGTKARPQALEAMRSFQAYLERVHGADHVDFGELAVVAGPRTKGDDPGLLTKAEIRAVYEALLADLEAERSQADASPELVRLAKLRIVCFVLLDASGIRPDSARGLTLADLYLFGEGRDFLLLRETGGYGAGKTSTAFGFVPLEGEVWANARAHIIEWHESELNELGGADPGKLPLFAETRGGRRRFRRTRIEHRIGQLVRWASAEKETGLYWLRKNRIIARHGGYALRVRKDEIPFAREVWGVLRVCGHASINVPIDSYISDPAIPHARSLREARAVARADVLAATRLKPEPLDVAWLRHGGADSDRRLVVVFERMGFPAVVVPEGRATTVPPLRRPDSGLVPADIDRYARVLQRKKDADAAMEIAGLSRLQVQRLDEAARELLARSGRVPWPVPGLRHPRAVMKPARRAKGTAEMFRSMATPPTSAMQKLANFWVSRGHSRRLIAERALLLGNEEELETAREALREFGIPNVLLTVGQTHDSIFLDMDPRGDRDQSSMRALFWVLAMIWLQVRLHGQAATD